ncbi:MAG: hypothetical protein HY748_15330 [Elusimicrobia bacterium]|nr:hypothetical protein [Elusimicrobiota bacterium]
MTCLTRRPGPGSGAAWIQPGAFRSLVRAYLLMDLRKQHAAQAAAAGPGSWVTPLYWVVAHSLAASAILSVALFGRVNARLFALAGISASMLLMAVSLVVEFREAILDLDDALAIGSRPVLPSTHAAARCANAAAYTLLLTTALNLFPAIVGSGLRDGGWRFLVSYAAASLAANLAITALALILMSLLTRVAGSRAAGVLAWAQTIVVMAGFYGAQMVFRDPTQGLAWWAYNLPGWVWWLPPAWFAAFVGRTCGGPGWTEAAAACGGVLALGAIWAAAIRTLSRSLPRLSEAGSSAPGRSGLLGSGLLWRRHWASAMFRSRETAAGFRLAWLMLRRDPDMIGRSLPALGSAAAGLALGLFSGHAADPFTEPGAPSIMSFVSLHLVVLAVPSALHSLSFSRDHEAAWVLRSAPIREPARVAAGLEWAVHFGLIAPTLAVLFVVLAWSWNDCLHAGVHCGTGFALALAAGSLSSGLLRGRPPFSRPSAYGSLGGPILLHQAVLAAALAAAGFLQALAYRSGAGTALLCLAACALAAALLGGHG